MFIKICGLKTPEIVDTCLTAGADFLGFMIFEKSPRYLEIPQAKILREQARGHAQSVVVLVNPDNELIDRVVGEISPDWIQLHGSETPARITEIGTRARTKILKALQVSTRADLRNVSAYEKVSDSLLLDAKPAPGALLPGGNGETFDWDILRGEPALPDFFLAGGLNLDNVGEAVRQIRPFGIDASTALEISRGVKDKQMIERFIEKARTGENSQ